MENQPQPHLRWITKTQAGWKYAETAKRALRALGLIEAEAAKVAGNLKSWWRNASASLYPKTIRLRSLSGLALAKLNPSATPNPAPPAIQKAGPIADYIKSPAPRPGCPASTLSAA